MRTLVRLLILVPLGILFGACAATFAIFFLSIFTAQFADMIFAAFYALGRFFTGEAAADPNAIVIAGFWLWSFTMVLLVVPVTLTAIIGEAARMRGALAHIILTGALTVILPLSVGSPIRDGARPGNTILACFFFTGAAAGLVYWLIAGRKRASQPAPRSI